MAELDTALTWQEQGSGAACRQILVALPEWFGVPATIEDYVASAERSPTVVATDTGGRAVGVLTLMHHGPDAAEIAVMGVLPGYHRHGIGRQLVASAEQRLRGQGVRFLQVKTLSDRHPDPGYARTRAFYRAMGFSTLQEFPQLWAPESPALLLIKYLGGPSA